VFDQNAGNSATSFQQDLVVQQQREGLHEAAATRDLTEFGAFEQHWFLGKALSARTNGGSSLSQQAEQERVAASDALAGIENRSPLVYRNDGTSTYYPQLAYFQPALADVELQGLRPAAAVAQSNRQRRQAVDMTGVAAIFVAALVLLTLAQVTVRRRAPAGHATQRWSVVTTLVAGGAAVAVGGLVLFSYVLLE
jgi:hypothetical protein